MSEFDNLTPNNGFELGWDHEITQDEMQSVLLPEGDYPFMVVNLEKARYTPKQGGKLPACNKAILTLRLTLPDGQTADLRYNLFLHSSQEWKLGAFFYAIGQKRKGEPLRMNWATVIGSTGRCHVKQRTYNGNTSCEIDRFHEPSAVPAPAAYQQPQSYAQPQGGGFTPGKF